MVVPDASLEDDLLNTRTMIHTNLKLLVLMGGLGLFAGAFVGMFFFRSHRYSLHWAGLWDLQLEGLLNTSGGSQGALTET